MKNKQSRSSFILDSPPSWMFPVGRLLIFVLMVTFVGGVARLYMSSAATPTCGQAGIVCGRVYDTRTGNGIANVSIDGCNSHNVVFKAVTGPDGRWSFLIPNGYYYCARVLGSIPSGYVGPSTNNQPENSGATTYENQVAATNCYHISSASCNGYAQKWDRGLTDVNVDFRYTSPAPPVIPNPTTPSNPNPVTNPPASKPSTPTTPKKTTPSSSTPQSTPAAPDTTAPSTPTGFTASADQTTGQIDLQWQAATDNVGVAGYQLERSTDQQNWDVADANITDTSYTDQSADFGTHYYYRLKALDTAGNSSGYATADATMSDFQANASAGRDNRITSDDKVATVLIPKGALDNDALCTLEASTTVLPPTLRGYTFIAGPYMLSCRDGSSDNITTFHKPLVLSAQVSGSSLKGVGKVVYFGQGSNNSWKQLKVTTHNKKTHQDTVSLDSYQTFVIMGKQKKTSIWIILFEIVLFIAAAILGLRFFVRWRARRQAEAQEEDYMHKSRGI